MGKFMERSSHASTFVFVTVAVLIGFLVQPFFDETVSGRQTFIKIFIGIILAFAGFIIIGAIEDRFQK